MYPIYMNNRSCERMMGNARKEKRPRVRVHVRPPGDRGTGQPGDAPGETLFDLAELFKIFGDSTRIKILYVLFESEMCVCDIAQLLGMTQSAISHQLHVLKRASLSSTAGRGRRCSTPWPTATCAPSWARAWTTSPSKGT